MCCSYVRLTVATSLLRLQSTSSPAPPRGSWQEMWFPAECLQLLITSTSAGLPPPRPRPPPPPPPPPHMFWEEDSVNAAKGSEAISISDLYPPSGVASCARSTPHHHLSTRQPHMTSAAAQFSSIMPHLHLGMTVLMHGDQYQCTHTH